MISLNKSREKLILIFILLLAFSLRFTSLTNFPAGFNADEASFGYDAYSLTETGKDQWGNSWPLVLKSFGDYKSPLYSYLSIPFIKLLGLTKFAIRLPNVIIGTFAVFAIYLLIKEILDRYRKNFNIKDSITPSLIGSFLLAVSPWHIMMSRGAFEANLITFFLPIGIYFFLKGLKNSTHFIYSALFLGLSLFTYHSAKLIAPLVVIGLLILFWKEIIRTKAKTLIFAFVIFLLFFFGALYTFKIGGGSRITERSIVQGALLEGAEIRIKLVLNGANPTISKLLHNKYQVIAQRFIFNYHQYFSKNFYFIKGAGESSYGMIPGIGVLNRFEGFLLLGFVAFLFRKETRKLSLAIILWLLIAPLPAALATGVGYSGNRAMGMIPVIQILAALGFVGWGLLLKRLNKRFIFIIWFVIAMSAISQVNDFRKEYFRTQPKSVLGEMLYGSLETSEWLSQNNEDKKVIVSRSLSEPQIFIAFANKWDPQDFQKQTPSWGFEDLHITWVDQIPEYSVGRYTFKSLDWKVDSLVENVFLVGRPDEFPAGTTPYKVFYYPDESPAVYIVDPSQKVFATGR